MRFQFLMCTIYTYNVIFFLDIRDFCRFFHSFRFSFSIYFFFRVIWPLCIVNFV